MSFLQVPVVLVLADPPNSCSSPTDLDPPVVFLTDLGAFGENSQTRTLYMALFDNIICRLRFPKFLTVVSRELDKDCAFVIEGLLQHGRLTLSQILDRATDFSNEDYSLFLLWRERSIWLYTFISLVAKKKLWKTRSD